MSMPIWSGGVPGQPRRVQAVVVVGVELDADGLRRRQPSVGGVGEVVEEAEESTVRVGRHRRGRGAGPDEEGHAVAPFVGPVRITDADGEREIGGKARSLVAAGVPQAHRLQVDHTAGAPVGRRICEVNSIAGGNGVAQAPEV